MAIEKNEIKDYGWNTPKTQAYEYLLLCILNFSNYSLWF